MKWAIITCLTALALCASFHGTAQIIAPSPSGIKSHDELINVIEIADSLLNTKVSESFDKIQQAKSYLLENYGEQDSLLAKMRTLLTLYYTRQNKLELAFSEINKNITTIENNKLPYFKILAWSYIMKSNITIQYNVNHREIKPEVLGYYESAEDIARKHLKGDFAFLATIYNKKSNTLSRMGFRDESFEWAQKALETLNLQTNEEYYLRSRIESMLGYLFMMDGQYKLANVHLKKSIEGFKKSQNSSDGSIFYPLKNYAHCLMRELNYKESIENLEYAIQLRKNKHIDRDLIEEKIYLMEMYALSNRFEDSKRIISEIDHLVKTQFTELSGIYYLSLAKVYSASNEIDQAQIFLKESRKYYSNIEMPIEGVNVDLVLKIKQSQFDEVLAITKNQIDRIIDFDVVKVYNNIQPAIEACIALANWELGSNYIGILENKLAEITSNKLYFEGRYSVNHCIMEYYLAKFKQEKNEEDLTNALHRSRELIRMREIVLQDSYDLDEQQHFEANWTTDGHIDIYILAFEAFNNLKYLEEAFKYIDNQKSRILKNKIRSNQRRSNYSLEEKNLDDQITTLEGKIHFANDDEQQALKTTLLKLKTQRKSENQKRTKQDFFKQESLSINKIKASLDDDSALIQIYKATNNYYVLFTSKAGIQYNKISHSEAFEKQLTHLLEQIQDGETTNINKLTDSLYERIFGDINIPDEVEKLVILPDGKLSYLPFDILRNKQGFFLINEYTIQTAYSFQVFQTQKLMESSTNKKALCFAPGYGQVDNISESSYYNLPSTKTEAEVVNKILGGKLVLNNEATENKFKSLAPKFKVIHLAMHGILDDENALNSNLLFSNLNSDQKEDEQLFAHEIMKLNLDADLVVLSACNSGVGKFKKGQGVMSLANAFSYAGVANTVMSLWKIPDNTTAKIMTSFYENLGKGQRIDKALQGAKLSYITDENIPSSLKHPYYWAGFVANGNMNPISASKFNSTYYFLISALLLGLFFFRSSFIKVRNPS